MTEQLVFAYAYLMRFDGKMPDRLPNGDAELPVGIPGYFVGNPDKPTKGNFEGRNNLGHATAHAARKSRELSTLVDMNFEGVAMDNAMTLLLQPIQEDPNKYKSAEELAKTHLLNHLLMYKLPRDAFERLFGKTQPYDPNFRVRVTRVSEEDLKSIGADASIVMLRDVYTIDGNKRLGGHLTIGRQSDLADLLVVE